MFDPITVAHLRRQHHRTEKSRRDIIIPALIALNVVFMATLLAII